MNEWMILWLFMNEWPEVPLLIIPDWIDGVSRGCRGAVEVITPPASLFFLIRRRAPVFHVKGETSIHNRNLFSRGEKPAGRFLFAWGLPGSDPSRGGGGGGGGKTHSFFIHASIFFMLWVAASLCFSAVFTHSCIYSFQCFVLCIYSICKCVCRGKHLHVCDRERVEVAEEMKEWISDSSCRCRTSGSFSFVSLLSETY